MNNKDFQQTIAEAYQPLFDYLEGHFGLICVKSEMDDIISAADKVTNNLSKISYPMIEFLEDKLNTETFPPHTIVEPPIKDKTYLK